MRIQKIIQIVIFLTSQIDTQFKYSVYFTNNVRLYTDTVNNCAIINNQKILSGPSYQIIDTKFETIKKNIVLSIGTPRIKNLMAKYYPY